YPRDPYTNFHRSASRLRFRSFQLSLERLCLSHHSCHDGRAPANGSHSHLSINGRPEPGGHVSRTDSITHCLGIALDDPVYEEFFRNPPNRGRGSSTGRRSIRLQDLLQDRPTTSTTGGGFCQRTSVHVGLERFLFRADPHPQPGQTASHSNCPENIHRGEVHRLGLIVCFKHPGDACAVHALRLIAEILHSRNGRLDRQGLIQPPPN